jgi:alpha-L-rhamnosidase
MTPRPNVPTFEHHADGRLGIGERRPRLSWIVDDAPPQYRQHAARVEVVITSSDDVEEASTHVLEGDEQVLVPWPARPLRSRDRVAVSVQVFDGSDWGPWSSPGTVEAGLLMADDWQAQVVGPAGTDGTLGRPPGRVRTEFTLPSEVVRARLYLSAHGLVEAEINGARVGDEEFTPGWTSYRNRLRYATFDVTAHLRSGANAMGMWLGDGWWRGRLGWGDGVEPAYSDRIGAIAQLEVVSRDGSTHTIATGPGWYGGPGPIVSSSLYDGEHVDMRMHDPSWSQAGTCDDWMPAEVRHVGVPLVEPTGPPVRVVDDLEPVAVDRLPDGRFIVDFGQNHAGRVRLRIPASSAGQRVQIRHAEVLQDGDLCLEPLRSAHATDVVTLTGAPVEWEPRFTVHGYRYVEITGWPVDLQADDIISRVIHTDSPRRGWFRSSDNTVNRLHENVVWSLRSNTLEIPTDCPQRDERLGWTGDIQVFAPTAAFLYGVTGMLSSWLTDLYAEQVEFDWVPPYVPYVPLEPFSSLARDPMALWGDVAVLTPAALHEATGDHELLRRQLDSGIRWMEHVERAAGPGRIVHDTEQLGDWLDPAAPSGDPAAATTDRYLVATAYFAHSARTLARIAETLDERSLAERYRRLADEVAAAYAQQYILPDGQLTSDAQTAYALTTAFDLWPDDATRTAGTERLAGLVRTAGGRIATGFAGTPVMCQALTLGGHLDEAYLMLLQPDCPGWTYQIRMGATTIWERWDSLRPDGTVNDPFMTSFNHYALGAVAEWLHRVVAGLSPNEPGWRQVRIAPRPGGGLTSAGATHVSPYGRVSVDWVLDDDGLHVTAEVPVGASAIIDLPGSQPTEVGHGLHRISVPRESGGQEPMHSG